MSAGAFTVVAYRSVKFPTRVFRVRVQPETTGLTVAVAGSNVVNLSGEEIADVTEPVFARVSGGNRKRGLKLGSVRFKFVDASIPPGNYLQGSTLTLPILNPAINGAGEGATGTYLGAAITVVGTSSEAGK